MNDDDTGSDNSLQNKKERLSGGEIMNFLLHIMGIPVETAFSQVMEKRITKIANDRCTNEDYPVVDNVNDARVSHEDIEKLVYLIDKDIEKADPTHVPIKIEDAKQITAEIIDGIKQEKDNESIEILDQIRSKVQSHVEGGKGSKLNEFVQNARQSMANGIKQDKPLALAKSNEYKGWERSKT